jgi:5-methylcytosine-specific restriction endonuclease McrA
MISPAVRALVRDRAGRRCEYCRAPEEVTGSRYLIDHIFPRSCGGTDQRENLAFACSTCNLAKSNQVTGVDPQTGQEEHLFHPRRHRWKDHFAVVPDSLELRGLTPQGRAMSTII